MKETMSGSEVTYTLEHAGKFYLPLIYRRRFKHLHKFIA